MKSLVSVCEWAREHGAEASFARLYISDLEQLASSATTVAIELVKHQRIEPDMGSLQVGDIFIIERKVIAGAGFQRNRHLLFRWHADGAAIPIDEKRGWSRELQWKFYLKKSSFFGEYDTAVPLEHGMRADPEYRAW